MMLGRGEHIQILCTDKKHNPNTTFHQLPFDQLRKLLLSCDDKRHPSQRNVDIFWRRQPSSIMGPDKYHRAESIFKVCRCFTSKYFHNGHFVKQPRPFGGHIVWFRLELIRLKGPYPGPVRFWTSRQSLLKQVLCYSDKCPAVESYFHS